MAYTLKSLREAALEENNEVDHSWFSEGFIDRSINDAVRRINARTEWLRNTATITIVKDQKVYSIADDVIKVTDVKNGDGDDVKPLPRTEEDHYGTPSPYHYRTQTASDGQTKELVVTPKPDSSDSGNEWMITYHKRPSELTNDSDPIPLPLEIRPHIMDYVNFRVQRKDKEQTTELDRQQWVNNFMTTMRTLRQTGERSTQIIEQEAQAREVYQANY